VNAVVHTHPLHSIAFAATGRPLQALSHEGSHFVPPDVSRFDLTGDLVRTPEVGQALADTLGDRLAVLMPRHGITTVGTDVGQAVAAATHLERACQIRTARRAGRDPGPGRGGTAEAGALGAPPRDGVEVPGALGRSAGLVVVLVVVRPVVLVRIRAGWELRLRLQLRIDQLEQPEHIRVRRQVPHALALLPLALRHRFLLASRVLTDSVWLFVPSTRMPNPI
jgi:hypothetical protein